ncbi:tyrosine-protein phosphatase non-receptor type 23-like [Diorhabda carinulata]|uniref:tyrosine-protein phosphatase non-receptor type 23-like n=1 Tax=Diorhabda carinulata TaxID=1163345 RepID=UPI0025A1DE08|nr:tyrosine-protein phosphatase non-receptor type 23-like [Diorhabda carinulata]
MNSNYMRLLIFLAIFQVVLIYAEIESTKSTLSDELDPLHDVENSEHTVKEQEKRTVLNLPSKNVAWVKHTAIKPSTIKYVLGYTPINLKLKPVLRPVAIKGYHYNRPRIQLQIKRPIVHIPQIKHVETGWKPTISVVKPVPVAAPVQTKPVLVEHVHVESAAHVDHIHSNPVPHVEHVHNQPVVHVDHIRPIHIKDHIHHVTTGHIDHLHHVAAAPQPVHAGVVHTPFVPSAQLFEVTKPDLGVLPLGAVFPTTALKEIPAPQLAPHPVHHIHAQPGPPIAAVPHPIHIPVPPAQIPIASVPFQVAPAPLPIAPVPAPLLPTQLQIRPAQIPIAPAPIPIAPIHNIHPVGTLQHGHLPVTHLHPVAHAESVGQLHHDHYQPSHFHADQPQPADHLHVHGDHNPLGHLHPVGHQQPGGQIEYHGIHYLHSLGPDQPPTQQLLPNHYHLQYPQIQHHQVHSNEIPNVGNNIYPNQQYPPLGTQPQSFDVAQNEYPQQSPQFNGYPNHFQPEPNIQDHYPDVQDQYINTQNDNRYQPAHQVSNQQFFREGQFQIGNQNEDQGYVYPQPSHNFIQPGQTDLQFPLHLPNHPGFNRGYEQDHQPEASQQQESFKPSIQLEPPYKK